MYIRKVLSFGNSWTTLNEKFPVQLNQIVDSLENATIENIEQIALPDRYANSSYKQNAITKLSYCLDSFFENNRWELSEKYIQHESRRKFPLHLLGLTSNQVSIKFIRHRELTNRWLYTVVPMAYKNSIVTLPIAICLLKNTYEKISPNRPSLGSDYEYISEELSALSPLSNTVPFLIMGVSFEKGQIDITELDSEADLAEQKVVINRAIEFPAEYHQAGLGILNYFGTIIREKYPDKNAKIRIEQDGLKVRMVIETDDGNKEIIEKLLEEYELVLTGEEAPEKLLDTKLQILELKNELGIAKLRVESAQNMIEHKSHEIETLKSLFTHSLTNNNTPNVNLTVSPRIQLANTQNNSTIINSDITDISDEIEDLLLLTSSSPDIEMKLLDLSNSMENIAYEDSKDTIKDSSSLKKLKLFLENAQDTESNVNKFITSTVNGIEKVQSIGEKYNSIAEWCGAPQIPRIFLENPNKT